MKSGFIILSTLLVCPAYGAGLAKITGRVVDEAGEGLSGAMCEAGGRRGLSLLGGASASKRWSPDRTRWCAAWPGAGASVAR